MGVNNIFFKLIAIYQFFANLPVSDEYILQLGAGGGEWVNTLLEYICVFFVTTDLAGFEAPLPGLTTVIFPGVDCTLIRHTGMLEVVANCPVSIRLGLDGRVLIYIYICSIPQVSSTFF